MMHGTYNVTLTHCNMMHGTYNVTLTHCNMMHGTYVTLTHCNMMHGTHNVKDLFYYNLTILNLLYKECNLLSSKAVLYLPMPAHHINFSVGSQTSLRNRSSHVNRTLHCIVCVAIKLCRNE